MAGDARGRRQRARRTSTRRAIRVAATTAAARSSTRSSSSRSTARSRSSAPSTRTSSRTRERRRTWPSTSPSLQPGDTILSLELSHGGHLTHGLKVNFSGRLYDIVHYGVSRETNLVDYDDVLALAEEAPAEAHRVRRLGVSADGRELALPRDRRRGRRAPPLRHGPLRGTRCGGPAPESRRALRLRHLDDAQDARRAAFGIHPLP